MIRWDIINIIILSDFNIGMHSDELYHNYIFEGSIHEFRKCFLPDAEIDGIEFHSIMEWAHDRAYKVMFHYK